ncbi:hypothetical protein G7Y31_08440 [Corynebacterium lizhenjunii]|uniref:Uncharacterized protein n=1 Tax=Corynebacterium lizhenjunii TaxID=2709394 RepID=A0A7T0KD55_9CORY|nr:hypothetical protein [Corynebacterium lizhenjunii]QPK78578.1 hypothetical protein G7Y31_08440 [Corynebacterium lizhenjunii]
MDTCVNDTAVESSGSGAVIHGVLEIDGMPAALRPTVEDLMVDCLRSESIWEVPGEDPLFAQWCTRWYKDWPSTDLAAFAAGDLPVPAGIGCHQVLTGTPEEFRDLAHRLAKLSEAYCFTARVSI